MSEENTLKHHIQHLFALHIETMISAADDLPDWIVKAGHKLSECLLNNGKIFVCGNAGSAANVQHFSTALMHHYEVERPPLPVISLVNDMPLATALVQDNQQDQIFSRSLQALGQSQDVLLLLSTTGQTLNLVHAVDAAHDRGMDVIVLCGQDQGLLANHLGPKDLALKLPQVRVTSIREMHLFVLNCLCDLIDATLFGHLTQTEPR